MGKVLLTLAYDISQLTKNLWSVTEFLFNFTTEVKYFWKKKQLPWIWSIIFLSTEVYHVSFIQGLNTFYMSAVLQGFPV